MADLLESVEPEDAPVGDGLNELVDSLYPQASEVIRSPLPSRELPPSSVVRAALVMLLGGGRAHFLEGPELVPSFCAPGITLPRGGRRAGPLDETGRAVR